MHKALVFLAGAATGAAITYAVTRHVYKKKLSELNKVHVPDYRWNAFSTYAHDSKKAVAKGAVITDPIDIQDDENSQGENSETELTPDEKVKERLETTKELFNKLDKETQEFGMTAEEYVNVLDSCRPSKEKKKPKQFAGLEHRATEAEFEDQYLYGLDWMHYTLYFSSDGFLFDERGIEYDLEDIDICESYAALECDCRNSPMYTAYFKNSADKCMYAITYVRQTFEKWYDDHKAECVETEDEWWKHRSNWAEDYDVVDYDPGDEYPY